jgi:hypothetical protein
MDNPYAPPSSANRETQTNSAAVAAILTKKPVRVWVLQILCALELVGLLGITLASLRAIPPNYLHKQFLPDLVRFVFGVVLLVSTIVALQRRLFARPDVVAPLAAGTLFLAHLVNVLLLDAKRLFTSLEQGLTSFMMFAAFLWLVGSLVLHRETRSYLRAIPTQN